jgi:hypothetical protein
MTEYRLDDVRGGQPGLTGGAYALLYRDEAGAPVEVVEFDNDGREIMRTYMGRRDDAA